MQNANKVGENLIVGAQVGNGANVGDGAAETGDVLTEVDQETVGRTLVVVERVVGQSIAWHRSQIRPVGKFLADRQRSLVGWPAVVPHAGRLDVAGPVRDRGGIRVARIRGRKTTGG